MSIVDESKSIIEQFLIDSLESGDLDLWIQNFILSYVGDILLPEDISCIKKVSDSNECRDIIIPFLLMLAKANARKESILNKRFLSNMDNNPEIGFANERNISLDNCMHLFALSTEASQTKNSKGGEIEN